jgi:hypothetical protein
MAKRLFVYAIGMMRKAVQGLKPLNSLLSKHLGNCVEKTSWQPPVRKFGNNDLVPVRIGFAEKDLMATAKAAKGRWNPEKKLWFILYGKIRGTALEKHIVLDAFPRSENVKSI